MNKVFWLAAVFAVAVSAGCSSPDQSSLSPDERWSGFPYTMGCTMDSGRDYGGVDPPAPLWAERVTMTHPGGQQVRLSIEFAAPPQTTVGKVVSPFTGQLTNAPGSLIYPITFGPKDGLSLFLSPSADGNGWQADMSTGKADPLNRPDNAALLSVVEIP
jgi:hypothetical protein